MSTLGKNEKWKVVWLCSVRHRLKPPVSTGWNHILQTFPNIQKHSSRSQIYWQVDEAVCRRSGLDVSTSENANLKLQVIKWNAHYSSAVVLPGVGTRLYKIIYTPSRVHSKKCFNKFNKFVQSTEDARQQSDGNPNSSEVAETMKLLANSSYGNQIMDRSRHTVTKYLSDEKTNCAINSKFFKKLDHVNHQLYEVELAKVEAEHKEPVVIVVVRFFILQYAKLRMLSSITTSSASFVSSTNSKSWKRTQFLSTLLLLNKTWPTVFDQRWKQNGRICDEMTAMTDSRRMH